MTTKSNLAFAAGDVWEPLAQAAERFELTPLSMYSLRARKGFPDDACARIGGRVMFNVSLIERWVRAQPAPKRSQPSKMRAALGLPQFRKDEIAEKKAGEARERWEASKRPGRSR